MRKKSLNGFCVISFKRCFVYMCVALLLTTGVTLSKFATSSTTQNSARVAKFGTLSLSENNKPDRYIFAPGFAIEKNPQISFYGNELAAYVFAEIVAEGWRFSSSFGQYIYDFSDHMLRWEVNNADWTFLSYNNETKTAVFYKLVPPGVELDGISIIKNDTITVSELMKASEMDALDSANMDITFKAYAVQSHGFANAASAWESVKSK